MNVLCTWSLVTLFVCSTADVAPGLPSYNAYAELEDADPFGNSQSRLAMASLPRVAPGMAAYTAAFSGLPTQSSEQSRQGVQPMPAAVANLDFHSIEPPQPLQQIDRAAYANEPSTAVALQQLAPALGATEMAGLGAYSMNTVETKAQELSMELSHAEAHEALLKAQNEQLRHQLDQWKVTGANIAEREAKVVALLDSPAQQLANVRDSLMPKPPAQAEALASSAPLASAGAAAAAPSMLQQAVSQVSDKVEVVYHHHYVAPVLMTMGVLFLLVSGWRLGSFMVALRKGEVGWKEALVSNASSQRLQPVLRAMGLAQFKVEVSEIHLGSLFAGAADIRVNFRMGSGIERRTKVLKNAGSTFLRFDDVLELTVCSSDAPCTICVTDKRGDLATVELPASEIVRLATRPHQEYFRTELTASPGLGDVSDRRPYVAMRMRNILAAPAPTPAMVAKLKGDKAAAERAYGSFAV